MQIIDLNAALAGLGAIALGLGGLLVFGRDRTADQHDLSDYHDDSKPAPAPALGVDRPGLARSRRDWPLVDVDSRPGGRRLRPGAVLALADPVVSVVTPPVARRLLIDHAVPTLSDAAIRGIADEWLREIADEQRALAGAR
ncbi:hypothetical protein [Micromonospora robiginosa]|uniref:Uncharacterized protein n=1 Tax=Micromonospora robiginosa TaxID=2749844 RepID=A0A7L6B7W6_9ACTN|nr:hypothetical protein [Micromonospora ferruginea]QLQ37955.1 hypothetical protein H1D33_03415 [Micromonospora ferruginea]